MIRRRGRARLVGALALATSAMLVVAGCSGDTDASQKEGETQSQGGPTDRELDGME